jgi:hypothetical protein
LAGTTLKDQEIAETDVVCWDGDGVGDGVGFGDVGLRSRNGGSAYGDVNFFLVLMMVTVMVLENTIGSLVKTMSEGVVMTWVV